MLVSFPQTSNFQFLLRQAFADDETSTRLLQILLFLLLSTASLMFIPCASRSAFTFPIHVLFVFLSFFLPVPARTDLRPVFYCPPSSLRVRATRVFG